MNTILSMGMESCQSLRHQDCFFCIVVTSKGELTEKVLPTLSNDVDEGWKEWHVKIIEENISVLSS